MLAQYSVPFSIALSAFREPEDPRSFNDTALADEQIRELARSIVLVGRKTKGWGAAVRIKLKNGHDISGEADSFKGCPETPFSDHDLKRKFRLLTGSGEEMFIALNTIEERADLKVNSF